MISEARPGGIALPYTACLPTHMSAGLCCRYQGGFNSHEIDFHGDAAATIHTSNFYTALICASRANGPHAGYATLRELLDGGCGGARGPVP